MSDDEKWMRRALQLAEKGVSGASPNPLVGCVIVKSGKIVGEGFHQFYGSPHAEINALKKAGSKSINATLYTNLEPCCHWGKTPPCTDALIQSGIKRVVAAMADPNPLVRSRGFKKLKAAGIAVKTGVLKKEAEDLNRAFVKFIRHKKPYVIVKAAMSIDGKIASASGESQWITSPASRHFSHRLRTEVDAIMVGAGTVRKDNPLLTSHGQGRNPVRLILSSSGKLPWNSSIFDGKSDTWICCPKTKKSAPRSAKMEWIRCKEKARGKIDFDHLMRLLAEKGISKLLIEGGGETVASAIESHSVDEIYFFIAPLLIGGRNAKSAFEGEGFKKIRDAAQLTKMTVRKLGPDLLINARIVH